MLLGAGVVVAASTGIGLLGPARSQPALGGESAGAVMNFLSPLGGIGLHVTSNQAAQFLTFVPVNVSALGTPQAYIRHESKFVRSLGTVDSLDF